MNSRFHVVLIMMVYFAGAPHTLTRNTLTLNTQLISSSLEELALALATTKRR